MSDNNTGNNNEEPEKKENDKQEPIPENRLEGVLTVSNPEDPDVAHLPYAYTLLTSSGPVEVTSTESSVAAAWVDINTQVDLQDPDLTASAQMTPGTGTLVVMFPEAIVALKDIIGIESGWASHEQGLMDDDEEDDDEDDGRFDPAPVGGGGKRKRRGW